MDRNFENKQRTTLKDIAKEINVSVTTVSKALNNHPDISKARRQEILELVEKRNYIPNSFAKNLRMDSSALIGVIVSDNANPYNSKVIKAMESIIDREGYYLLIANTNENVDAEERIIKKMLATNVCGILLCPAMGNTKTINLLRKHNVPYVLFNRYIEKDQDSYVVADDTLAARIGAQYLISMNDNRKIVFLGPDMIISTACDRMTGFKEAMETNGRCFDKKSVFTGILDFDDGYKAIDDVLELFSGEKLSVLCYSDYIALGVLKRLQEKKLNSSDINVMGIDGVEMFSTFLTSVHLPKYSLGLLCAEILINKIQGGGEDKRIVMSKGLEITGIPI